MSSDIQTKQYAYGRIAVLDENLHKAGIAQEIIDQVMQGGEAILQSTSPEKKAGWMKEAMHRMDQLIDRSTRYAVRQSCACCLGGKRLQLVKAIDKKGGSLADRIRAANETKMVFGHSVTLQEDGTVLVHFAPEGLAEYRCVCLPKAQEAVSVTYCYCCGGHVKHHLQVALGQKLAVKVRSSALTSMRKKPCTFVLTIAD